MRLSKLAAALVVGLGLIAGIGSLAVLAMALRPTTAVVVALVVLAVVATSAVGARSRRWLSNPYW
jgi:hypothetical protein